MILKRIYTVPEIFDVKFDLGINYIYGEKHIGNSLNGIGKSLFLDFIDFCLLSHYERTTSSRLRSAYDCGLLNNTSVTLEFTINSLPGYITRSFDNSREAVFNWEGKSDKYEINDLRNILGNLVFNSSGYSGIFESEWFRRLISFYIKIQKYSEEKFTNPVKFSKDLKVYEIPVYLFHLLFINNELPYNFCCLIKSKKSIDESITTIRNFISKNYGVIDLGEVRHRIEELNNKILEVDQNIKKLYLLRNYDKFEAEADNLTAEIKELYYANSFDKKTIEEYNNSLLENQGISSANVERIYIELRNEFGIQIKQPLDEAIAFRRDLSTSRKQFIKSEVEELTRGITEREKLIEEKEQRRIKILNNLYSKTAYTDLTAAFKSLADLNSQKEELISRTRILNDLNNESNNLTAKQQEIFNDLPAYISSINSEINNFNNVVDELIGFIYPDEEKEFLTIKSGRKDTLLNLKFWEKVKHSHGKNIGRTLIFDFALLLNNIYNNHNFPRFLIHDGIFDSLDKSHLIKTYEFIQKKIHDGYEFQYITTINESGFVGKNFGSSDVINPDRMKNEAKIVVSPNNKLLKADF